MLSDEYCWECDKERESESDRSGGYDCFDLGHSMSNQNKKILIPTDLNTTWFLHAVS